MEGGPAADLRVEREAAAVALDDDAAGQRQALAGPAADVLGSEERVVDAAGDVRRDAGAGVADAAG